MAAISGDSDAGNLCDGLRVEGSRDDSMICAYPFPCDKCHLTVELGMEYESYWSVQEDRWAYKHQPICPDIDRQFNGEDLQFLQKIGASVQ